MANTRYFDFLGSVWDNLSSQDRQRFGELWHAYEQIIAAVYQNMVENDLNVTVRDLQKYQMKRWLNYSFNTSNQVIRPPTYTSTQDLSAGIRTDSKYLLRFSVDGGHPFEVDIRGDNALVTTIDGVVKKINKAAGFIFAKTLYDNTIIQLVGQTSGPQASIQILTPSDITKDATEYIMGIEQIYLPKTYPKYPYIYPLPYENIADLPEFRTHIRDESEGLVVFDKDIDFGLEPGFVSFKEIPPTILWAKKTFFDEETPWNNFGFLMGIYQKNTPAYLSVIQGLWYAFWSGPKPQHLQTALYLLFGLPIALEDCVVTDVTATEIQTLSSDGIARLFAIPTELFSLVVVGQAVPKYQPLVNGIEIFDKINYPGFVTEEIGRAGIQRFLTEDATRGYGDTDETKALTMLEEHTFLPQISVEAFISPDINLGNVKLFLNSIKPLTKTFLFQVIIGAFKEEIVFGERLGIDIALDISPNLDSNQTTFAEQSVLDDYENNDNEGLNLDSEGVIMQERLEIEVYSFGTLIDSFVG